MAETSSERAVWRQYLDTLPDDGWDIIPPGTFSLMEELTNIHGVSTADRATLERVIRFLTALETVLTDVLFIGPAWQKPHAHRVALLRILCGIEQSNWLVPEL